MPLDAGFLRDDGPPGEPGRPWQDSYQQILEQVKPDIFE
jgi:hypothetical protein